MNGKIEIFRCPFYDQCNDNRSAYYGDKMLTFSFSCKAPFLKIKYNRSPVCIIAIDEAEIENWVHVLEDLTIFKHPKKYPKKNPVRKKK